MKHIGVRADRKKVEQLGCEIFKLAEKLGCNAADIAETCEEVCMFLVRNGDAVRLVRAESFERN